MLLTQKTIKIKSKNSFCADTCDVIDQIKETYQSVVAIDYIDTTKTSGEWIGILVQKMGNNYYAIPFEIENPIDSKDLIVHTNTMPYKYRIDNLPIDDEKGSNGLWDLSADISFGLFYNGDVFFADEYGQENIYNILKSVINI